MNVYLVGLNHHTAPVNIREKVAINADRLEESLLLLRQYIPNGIILSTCNRTEIYAAGSQPSEEAILNFIDAMTGVSFVDLLPHIYLRENGTAFKHLFRIASGLDSMVLGETEILGQPYNLSFSSSGFVNVQWRGPAGDAVFLYPTRSGAFFASGGNVSWQQITRSDGTKVNLVYPAVSTGRITLRNQNGSILIGDVP